MSGPHRHYTYYWRRCVNCGRPAVDCSEYCNECEPLVEDDEDREPPDADSVPKAFPCTCPSLFEPSSSLFPSDRRLDRYCPQHGDGGPDPDAAYEARRDQLMEDRLHGYTHNNED